MSDPRWSPAWKRLRIQCYERDKARHAVCVHCGQPIDYEANPSTTDDSYPSVIIPSMRCCRRMYRLRIKSATGPGGAGQGSTTLESGHATGGRGVKI